MGSGAQGLTLDTAASIYQGAISDQAIAGYMVVSIPIIATAIIKGGEVAFQAVSSGMDAGVFRYQASLSRLASTFTVTERQATALGENAREAAENAQVALTDKDGSRFAPSRRC